MTIRVLLFASLADRAGRRELVIEAPRGARVADAIAAIVREHPALAEAVGFVATAVNASLARRDQPLREGDTLALLPPVSGG